MESLHIKMCLTVEVKSTTPLRRGIPLIQFRRSNSLVYGRHSKWYSICRPLLVRWKLYRASEGRRCGDCFETAYGIYRSVSRTAASEPLPQCNYRLIVHVSKGLEKFRTSIDIALRRLCVHHLFRFESLFHDVWAMFMRASAAVIASALGI